MIQIEVEGQLIAKSLKEAIERLSGDRFDNEGFVLSQTSETKRVHNPIAILHLQGGSLESNWKYDLTLYRAMGLDYYFLERTEWDGYGGFAYAHVVLETGTVW